MKKNHSDNIFDAIIIGAGCAGWSMAYHLKAVRPNLSILLLDKACKTKNDRTWCFWEACDPVLQDMVCKSWDYLSVHHTQKSYRSTLKQAYQCIQAADFYRTMRAALPDCQFVQTEVHHVKTSADRVYISTEAQNYVAKYVFDSRLDASFALPTSANHPFLL
ncbi:MAG: FAD-dependent oxidoreductase, partial [Bacteroidota bacterium]